MNQRSQEAEKLLDWAYREWADYKLVKAGDPIDDAPAPVFLGTTATVPVTVKSDVLVSLPRNARSSMKVTAVYDQSVPAPVAQGQQVGMLQITANDMTPVQVPLVATKAVDKVSGFSRAALAAGYLLFGKKN
jgi:D-alanyl-D-alanine carboxypeptidase (penicillin-binding protein 5/6)